MSYAPEVIADRSGKFCGNALRFATEQEAQQYVGDLMSRWTAVTDTRVVKSEDPVNYRIVNNVLEHWDDATRCNRCHNPLPSTSNGTCWCGGLIEETGWVR